MVSDSILQQGAVQFVAVHFQGRASQLHPNFRGRSFGGAGGEVPTCLPADPVVKQGRDRPGEDAHQAVEHRIQGENFQLDCCATR